MSLRISRLIPLVVIVFLVAAVALPNLAVLATEKATPTTDAAPSDSTAANAADKNDSIFNPRSAAELRTAVNEALRATALVKEPDAREHAIRQLMLVMLELEQDQNINHDDRVALHSQVRSRLISLEKTLRLEAARQAKQLKNDQAAPSDPTKSISNLLINDPASSAKSAVSNVSTNASAAENLRVLAQLIMLPGQRGGVAPAGQGNGPAGRGPIAAPLANANSVVGQSLTADYGRDLVDLIHAVVEPRTWDVNGGPGSVIYFRNFQVLVVTAPSEVHSQVGDLLGQLRK